MVDDTRDECQTFFFLKGDRLNDSVLLTKKFNFTRNRHSWNRWIVIHTITVCTVFGKIGFFHRLHVIHTNMLIIFNSWIFELLLPTRKIFVTNSVTRFNNILPGKVLDKRCRFLCQKKKSAVFGPTSEFYLSVCFFFFFYRVTTQRYNNVLLLNFGSFFTLRTRRPPRVLSYGCDKLVFYV